MLCTCAAAAGAGAYYYFYMSSRALAANVGSKFVSPVGSPMKQRGDDDLDSPFAEDDAEDVEAAFEVLGRGFACIMSFCESFVRATLLWTPRILLKIGDLCCQDAAAFVQTYGQNFSSQIKLAFYAYYKQATEGPCTANPPPLYDMVGRAKWCALQRSTDPPLRLRPPHASRLSTAARSCLHPLRMTSLLDCTPRAAGTIGASSEAFHGKRRCSSISSSRSRSYRASR